MKKSQLDKVILFDLDGTLIDTRALMSARIRPAICKFLQIAEPELAEVEVKYLQSIKKSTEFNPKVYLHYLATYFSGMKKTSVAGLGGHMEKIFYKPEHFIDSVFPEVNEIMSWLTSDHHNFSKIRVGLFTEGVENYQRQKIKLARLEHWFDSELMFIFNDKTSYESLSNLPSEAIIIDDNYDVIDQLHDHFKLIWLRRAKKLKQTSNGLQGLVTIPDGVITIENLTELKKFLI